MRNTINKNYKKRRLPLQSPEIYNDKIYMDIV